MRLVFAESAWQDYLFWQKQDRRMVERINTLIRETQREPFAGIGKPEPLNGDLSGFWSRRIDDTHRIVYRVEGDTVEVAQCIQRFVVTRLDDAQSCHRFAQPQIRQQLAMCSFGSEVPRSAFPSFVQTTNPPVAAMAKFTPVSPASACMKWFRKCPRAASVRYCGSVAPSSVPKCS